MMVNKNNEKMVAAALLTHINMGKTSFTVGELDEELPVKRNVIEYTLEDLKEKGLFAVSDEEGIYIVAADIRDFRDYYLNIGKQVSKPAPKDELDRIRIPAKIAEMCEFGQRRRNRRLPPIVDVNEESSNDWLDNIDIDELLNDVDSKDFDELFDSVFGDDDGE